jgi:hypothetical protein
MAKIIVHYHAMNLKEKEKEKDLPMHDQIIAHAIHFFLYMCKKEKLNKNFNLKPWL